uniref:Guanine nucleotide-binding protein subunit beta-like protein n=1 Tax=Percolomonas cosmopolitus TaxID=63605 RepID=A0A7S1PE19_9EUKA
MPSSTVSDLSYTSISSNDSLDSLDPTLDETLHETLHRVKQVKGPTAESNAATDGEVSSTQDAKLTKRSGAPSQTNQKKDKFPNLNTKPQLKRKSEVIDDFIRNFLRKHGMNRTLDSFQEEWYEIIHKNKEKDMNVIVPDAYLQNQSLDDEVKYLQQELMRTKEIAQKAMEKWDKMKKERDYHKMHHQRVQVEKKQLTKDLKRLRKHCEKYDPTLLELRRKYETAMKEKMLMRLDRDKQAAQLKAVTVQMEEQPQDGGAPQTSAPKASDRRNTTTGGGANTAVTTTVRKTKRTTLRANTATGSGAAVTSGGKVLPPDDRVNPYMHRRFAPAKADEFSLTDTFQGHTMAVSYLAIHPKKPIVATVSDDTTWKMWALPTGKVLMSGDGHADWLSGCDFHPNGTHLATSSGDSTVKIWDFFNQRCAATFTSHTQAVWACEFHDSGDFLASCSLDHTAKLWDITSNRCRATFRGQHKDSVNHVTWQPYSNVLATCSGDHSVSLWDARTTTCLDTFYGHEAAVNHCKFSLRGDTLVSCDADGKVFVWDIRMVTEIGSIDAGPHAANHVSLDSSGDTLVISCNDGKIRAFSGIKSGKFEQTAVLEGHDDAVQAAVFDRDGKFLVSAGSDCMLRLWS